MFKEEMKTKTKQFQRERLANDNVLYSISVALAFDG